jgi:hypothetical protein
MPGDRGDLVARASLFSTTRRAGLACGAVVAGGAWLQWTEPQERPRRIEHEAWPPRRIPRVPSGAAALTTAADASVASAVTPGR